MAGEKNGHLRHILQKIEKHESLAGVDLRNLYLSSMDLSNLDLRGANLKGCRLSSGADFSEAKGLNTELIKYLKSKGATGL